MRISKRLAVSLCVAIGAAAGAAQAQQSSTYPSRPVTVIVPFPPGGIIDTIPRMIGPELQKRLGQPVVVENRAGAGGWIGVQHFTKLPADGHALLSGASPMAVGELFLKTASFVPGKDVAPITGVAYAPYVIITSTQLPVKTLKEWVAHVKANPGKLNFAIVTGAGQHLDTLDFLRKTGLDMLGVPYQGGAAALRALLANESQGYFGAAFGLEQNIQAGKITALAVTSARPFPPLPEIPTVKQAIGIDFEAGVLYGLFGSVGTPAPIIGRLHKELVDIVQNTDVAAQLRKQSYEIRTTSPEEYAALLNSELRRGREVARAAKIEPQL